MHALIISAPDAQPANAHLERRALEALRERLQTSESYSSEEIAKIEQLDAGLLPEGFRLDEESGERLRALCRLSHCELRPATSIRSHRPLLGPCIVAAKRLLWRIIGAQLDEPFRGLQEYSSWMVYSHAKLLARTEQLEQRLLALETNKTPQARTTAPQ